MGNHCQEELIFQVAHVVEANVERVAGFEL
jgi:hypothetical protein